MLMDRPLPTLADLIGDGTRAEGFEEWVRETVGIEAEITDPDERAMIRLIRILAVACMESARKERDEHGRNDAQTAHCLARAAGVAIMVPILCIARDDVPLNKLVRLLADDFKHGAKRLAGSAEKHRNKASVHG